MNKETNILTKSDIEFLAECPRQIWFPEEKMILWRRYRYRLQRLANAGIAIWMASENGRDYFIESKD